MQRYLLSLDQGTTSSRAILFTLEGSIVASSQYEFDQHYPAAGYVEHDPDEILISQLRAVQDVLLTADVQAGEVVAIGVTNQRETTIVWDRKTGRPVYPAIVWQCRRTAPLCEKLIEQGLEQHVRDVTGLRIDAYFSATKLRYILDHIENGQARAKRGELMFGTVDTWLIYNLTGEHVTDYSNASRTMLFDIHKLCYDPVLLQTLNIPECILPTPLPSAHIYGRVKVGAEGLEPLWGVPVSGDAGDQQAALFGQACFYGGQAKCTYGTGSFLMMNTGDTPIKSEHSLLSTIAWGVGDKVEYALEGSIFNAGSSIKWLRDEMKMIDEAHQIDELAATVDNANGAYFVSAFTGLGAPHWDMYARGALVGLTRDVSRAHVCRAVLEGIAYQVYDLAKTMEKDCQRPLTVLKVDGGASVSDVMMQFQADMLGIPVNRPRCVESTAIGAAFLAGLGVGCYKDIGEIIKLWKSEQIFMPAMNDGEREKRLYGWTRAIERAKHWEE
ncbi:MAG: glycerol kinase GlpK [Eubacteriales bacterium]|nr:glycerol kinase GlpK [Eubacteriales bacterium]